MVYIEPDVIWMVVVGFIIAFVLAIGIGANDVANTFGTSVGSKVLTLRQACIIASIVETLGAILLGAKVTATISKGIIDITPYENNTELLLVGNVAALTGSCVWLIIATAVKMPVSGTHSIVGATVGFALVAHGAKGVNWKELGLIVLSWFTSPALSGAVSVALFMVCKYLVLNKPDPLEPGLRLLPIFYSCTIIVNFFSIFFEGPEMLGFHHIPLWGVFVISFGAGIIAALVVLFFFIPWQRKTITRKVRLQKEQEAVEAMESLKQKELEEAEKHLEPIVEEDHVNKKPSKPRVTIMDGNNEKAQGDGQLPSFIFDNEIVHSATNGDIKEPLSDAYSETVPLARSRSKSLLDPTSSPEPVDKAGHKRTRSKSESTSEHLKKSQQSSRVRRYSGSIDDLRNRRFLPVDKSMALNIEKQVAETEEEKLEKQGVPSEEIAQKTREVIEDKPEQYQLFSYLQILTAIFGGFAHGGNDVSNAIGPLVGMWTTATSMSVSSKAPAPVWILFYGGVGISIGLWIWGRRVIKTMGQDLAKITPSTGFCIELGAATTVLTASNFGLPISTTHCKVGSVVFVGWARSRKNVDWKLFSTIFLAWILTLPVTGGISAAVMAGLMQLV